jgi:hypothetical protein
MQGQSRRAVLAVESLETRRVFSLGPVGDRFEPNDTRQTAANLGTVSGSSVVSDLDLRAFLSTDEDYFRFTTVATGTSGHHVDVLFTHAAGDVDARLLDASGNQLASSTGTSDRERLSLQGRPAGTYFLKVYGHARASNSYRLAFEAPGGTTAVRDRYEANDTSQTATDLRTISGAAAVADLSIHTTSDRDFYKFVTTGPGTSAHYVDVLFTHAGGDVDARLLDASGNLLASSTGTSDRERLSLQERPAGTYFLEVFGHASARNSYRLAFQAPTGTTTAGDRYEANNTRQTATDLRTISGAAAVADLSIHTTSDRDFYKFVTTGPGTSAHYVDVLFTHTAGDVDARLLNASGNVLTSSTGTSDSERLSLQGRPAGTYFLEVFGHASARNSYRLAFQAPTGTTTAPSTPIRTNPGLSLEKMVDMANTEVARKIEDKLRSLAQGNERSAQVARITVNRATGDVTGGFKVRHRQVWKTPFGKVVAYDLTQSGNFTFNIFSLDVRGSLNLGRGIRVNLADLKALSEGDLTPLWTAAVSARQRSNYDGRVADIRARHGAENVYVAPKSFVDWMGPSTLVRWGAEAVLSSGASLSTIPAEVANKVRAETLGITNWLRARVSNAATVEAVAGRIIGALANRGNIEDPQFSIRWSKVDYWYESNVVAGIRSQRIEHGMYSIVLKI